MTLQCNSMNFFCRKRHPDAVKVAFAITDSKDPNLILHEAEKLIPHEKFTHDNFDYFYNIGLIKLKEKIAFNAKVQPIKLPTSDNLEGGFPTVATGYGTVRIISF